MRKEGLNGPSLILIGGLGAVLIGFAIKLPIPHNERVLFGFSSVICLMALGYSFADTLRWRLIKRLLTYRNWIYQPKSLRTKIWGSLLSLTVPKENNLFDFQEYLPKFPLPRLEDTCKRTLEMVKPLLKEKDFQLVIDAIDDLKTNEGPQLQAVLEQRYKKEENWVSELWDKYAYLSGRTPLPVHSNFATMGDLQYKTNVPKFNQLSQAGNVIHLCMEYHQKIKNNAIRNTMIQNVVPVCCDRYKYICSTTRIPGEDIDELKKYQDSTHAIVFRKGFMYRLEVCTTDKDGNLSLFTPKEMQTQIRYIMDDADKRAEENGSGINPGIFTAIDRTKWARIRKEMMEDKVNAESLKSVESAVFCVALDTTNPQNISEEFHEFLTGNGFNRWYDKSLTTIITNNGALGLNVEHTTAEATLSGRLWEYCFYHSAYDDDGNATDRGLPSHDNIPTPTFLQWNIQQYEFDIDMFKDDFESLEKDIDTIIYLLKKGKSFIKKLRISPDGYMQMALQLAFYRLHRETPKTYETATTRLFKLGRTETIRPVSEHSIEFTKTFDDPTVPRSEVISHLKKAIRYQTNYKYDSMNGKGVDRHLFGLYVVGKMIGTVPKLFSLKPFNESDRLSTSQSPLRYDVIISKTAKTDPVGGGFGAQRKDGYGVSYFMDENKVNFLVSSFKSCAETDSLLFVETVEQAVDDMEALLKGATGNGTAK